MSEKYEIVTHGMNGRYGVINTTIPDDEERVIVTCDTEVRARLVVDELNKLQHQIDEKPLNLHEDFQNWYELIERINKNSRRLVEIDEEYKEKSEKYLQKHVKLKKKQMLMLSKINSEVTMIKLVKHMLKKNYLI